MRNWVKTAIGLVTAAFLLAGCAGASGNDGGATSGSTPSGTGQIETAPRQTFPLDAYLDAVWGTELSVEAQKQESQHHWERQQELITKCMHSQGFEYDPYNLPFAQGGAQTLVFTGEPENREWVAQYGYGIALWAQFQQSIWTSPGFTAPSLESADGISVSTEIPQIEHNLTPAEIEAFRVALHGPRGDYGLHGLVLDTEGITTEEWFNRRGCQGQADWQMENERPSGLRLTDEFAPLFDAIEQMQTDTFAEVTAAEIDWAACMADAGEPGFERRSGPFGPDGINGPIWTAQNQITMNPVLGPIQRAELLEREIELALADFDCRVAVDFEARQTAHRTAIETQFVNDHRSALEALRDAAEQRGLAGS